MAPFLLFYSICHLITRKNPYAATLMRFSVSFGLFLSAASLSASANPPWDPSAPWGHLRVVPTVIEIPDEMISYATPPTNAVQWFIGTPRAESAAALLGEVGLDSNAVRRVMERAVAEPDGSGFRVTPPEDVILSMDPGTRGRLYRVLARWDANFEQKFPVRFDRTSPVGWLDKSDLPAGTKSLIQGLLYEEGDLRLFSDYTTVLHGMDDPKVQRALVEVLSRQATLLVRVQMGSPDEVDGLVRYWGFPDRAEQVRPILESAAMAAEPIDTPVTLLLPRFARSRLYMYRREGDPRFADCHWSSFNFFREAPDPAFTNAEHCRETLLTEYVAVTNAPRLGDLILFRDEQQKAVHSCNYIADDIVFTKNGGALGEPWILAHLDDVTSFYGLRGRLTVNFFRLRSHVVGFQGD